MKYYIIFALQLLLASLIVWRMRQHNGQPAGCLAIGYIILIIVVVTGIMMGAGYFAANEIVDIIRGSQSAITAADWAITGGLCILTLVIVAGICSAVGFAFTGHHPDFCKEIWKTLASIIFLPLVVFILAGISFGCAFIISMRIASPMFDDMGWGWLILPLIFGVATLFASAGMIAFLLEQSSKKLKEYDQDNKNRSYQLLSKEHTEI